MTGYAARYPDEEFEVVALEKHFEGPIVNPDSGAASRSFALAGKVDGNLPVEYQQQTDSGLDRLKIEALSFGSQERNFTKARASMALPSTAPLAWPASAIGYLIPWFNGGCPWDREWLAVTDAALNPAWVGFWAIDHLCSFGWSLPLPVRKSNSQVY